METPLPIIGIAIAMIMFFRAALQTGSSMCVLKTSRKAAITALALDALLNEIHCI